MPFFNSLMPMRGTLLLHTLTQAIIHGLHFDRLENTPRFQGAARRTRESPRMRVSNPRETMFKALQSLGHVPAGAPAETVSPWARFDKALGELVKTEARKPSPNRYVVIYLPNLPRNIRRKVLSRLDGYASVQARFGQKSWEPPSRW